MAGTDPVGVKLPECELTPAMIEAGERALVMFDIDFESHREAAIRVYLEMTRARVALDDIANATEPAPEEDCEVEITPEMMAAGIAEYALFESADPGEWVVDAIYRVMRKMERRAASVRHHGSPLREPP